MPAIAKDPGSVDMRIHRDINYADAQSRKTQLTEFDLYAPASETAHPIVIWIHGGGWQIGDKGTVGAKPAASVQKGCLFVSVNYRLVPAVEYKDQAADIAKAIRWIHDHAQQYGGTAIQIFLMGHSAGAHFAALLATDPQ